MKPRILVAGPTYIDFICATEAVPEKGKTHSSELGYAFVPGGNGTYLAVGAARLGADVVYCTSLGNDSYASQLKSRFEREGIDTRFVTSHKNMQTGLCVTIRQNSFPDRCINYPGANARLCEKDLEDAFSCYPDAIMVSAAMGEENLVSACNLAAREGAMAFVDLCGAKNTFNVNRIGKAEIIILDENSVYSLCGMYTNDVNGCLNACISLSAKINAKYFVINLYNRGCFVYDGTYSKIVSPEDYQTADNTASHEAFCACLAYKYTSSADIQTCCELAQKVLAYTASHNGGIASLPKFKEIAE